MQLFTLLPFLLFGCANAFHSPFPKTLPKRAAALTTLHALEPASVLETVQIWLADASSVTPPESGGVSYSRASYYTILGLYLISFPGLWSTIKRSTTAKMKRKTYVSPGEKSKGRSLRDEAGEIMAYMKANNYEVVDTGETITFRGIVQRSLSQALFLGFITIVGLLSLALVLDIQFHDLELPVIGKPNWYYLALLGPYAGIYYWQSGDRVDDCQVRLETNEEETENEITVQGSEDELERMWKALGWQEKGSYHGERFNRGDNIACLEAEPKSSGELSSGIGTQARRGKRKEPPSQQVGVLLKIGKSSSIRSFSSEPLSSLGGRAGTKSTRCGLRSIGEIRGEARATLGIYNTSSKSGDSGIRGAVSNLDLYRDTPKGSILGFRVRSPLGGFARDRALFDGWDKKYDGVDIFTGELEEDGVAMLQSVIVMPFNARARSTALLDSCENVTEGVLFFIDSKRFVAGKGNKTLLECIQSCRLAG